MTETHSDEAEAALADEARFIAQLREANLPRPDRRGTTESGEVCMTWLRNGKIVVSLSLEGDGMYGAAMQRGGSFKACGEDGDLNRPLNEELVAYLRELKP